uniref:Uncharacterized protein n=1 Tax=Oryza nivara TaxID=4536 RepID=A0A0E0G7M3_ORYNI
MSSPAEKSTSGGGGMSMNTVTTVMAFSVSAFFVLFIFVRLLCARIHLRAGQSAAAAAAAHGDAFPAFSVERGIRGLEPAVVTSFPTAKFGDGGSRPRAAAALEESQLHTHEGRALTGQSNPILMKNGSNVLRAKRAVFYWFANPPLPLCYY